MFDTTSFLHLKVDMKRMRMIHDGVQMMLESLHASDAEVFGVLCMLAMYMQDHRGVELERSMQLTIESFRKLGVTFKVTYAPKPGVV
jgi:hypothetical protein